MMRRLPILLLSVNFVLAALLAWLWIAPDGSLRDVHWHPPVAIRPDLGSLSTAVAQQEDSDLSTFMAILDRPLFSSSRRPASGSLEHPSSVRCLQRGRQWRRDRPGGRKDPARQGF
jgi:hypothetical protein